jgi:hypothetical protein
VNLFQFILTLTERGQPFTLVSFGDRRHVETGRHCYIFSRMGKSMGGWIHKPESDAEWQEWMERLKPRP